MRRLLFLLICVLGTVWSVEFVRARWLQRQLEDERDQVNELLRLRRQHDQLEAGQLSDAALATLRRSAQMVGQTVVATEAKRTAPPAAVVALGEWAPVQAWKNAGDGTPEATLETALYAAAGGDVALFSRMIELPEEVRQKIDQARAKMTESNRALYPTAEDLVAALAIRGIPTGEAQLVWSQPAAADTSVACLFLRNPPPPIAAEDPLTRETAPGPQGIAPPELPRDANSKTVVLTLHHQPGTGWRLLVPPDVMASLRDFGLKP